MTLRFVPYLLRIVLLAALYFGAAKVGLLFSFVEGNVTLIWPPTGIALAALLIFGYRLWPGVAIGVFLATASTSAPIGFVLAATIGNSLESLIGVYLLHRVGFDNGLMRVRDVVGLIVLAAAISTTVSATFGVAGLAMTGMAPWSAYFSIWWHWWLGNAMGVLIVAPVVLLTWSAGFKLRKWSYRRLMEAGLALLFGVGISLVVFSNWFISGQVNLAFVYLPFPILMWGALRFGPSGAATLNLVVNTIAVLGTIQNSGPFAGTDLNESLLLLWVFMGIASVTSLLTAAITAEREQAQAALWQSQQHYKLFLEQAPIGVQVFSPDGMLVEVNTAWEEMWGAKAEQVVGNFNALNDPQIEKMSLLPFIKRIFSGESVDIPDTFYNPEASGMPGRKRWIRTYAYHITDQAGTLQNVVVLQEDITEQKQAEEKLKESEANLQAIFNNTLQAFLLFNRDQKIVAFNNVANNWSKALLDRELHEGGSAEQLFAELIVNKFPTAFERVLKGEIISREAQVQIAGQNYWFEVNYTPVTVDDGSVVGVCLSVLNISERKQLEEQLHQAQKMEAIGRLAGGIAHDFNNLLTIIAGNCDLALDQLGDNSPLRREVEQIKKAGNRAASLTRQLLAFSRQQVLQPTALNLNNTVIEISKMLSRLIGENIELETRLQQDLNLVKVDPGKIEQVILNLAVNARDAMPQGGNLTIETANVELDEAYARQHVDVTPGPYVMLAISDNGGGMDAETQVRIFDPFFTTKEIGEGTGLGLAMVHGIVNQSGGHIWVYSEPNQGTTFKVYLPQVEQEVVSTVRHQPAVYTQTATETILLVEDEPMVRELAYRILTMEGYLVLQANNAQAALQLSQRHTGPIHLLLTDVVMPGGISGRQLAEQLVLLRAEIKVLYMSGYTDNAIIHHGVLEPGTNFLEKPFTPDALTHKVREVLNSERSNSST